MDSRSLSTQRTAVISGGGRQRRIPGVLSANSGWRIWPLGSSRRLSQLPDVVMQLGYSSYLGNEELALNVRDASLSVGYSIPIGQMDRIHSGTVSPYGGIGFLRINATPQMSEDEQESLGIRAVSGSAKSPSYIEGFAPLTFHGGLRILSGDFQVLLNLTVAPSSMVTLNSGLGFVF